MVRTAGSFDHPRNFAAHAPENDHEREPLAGPDLRGRFLPAVQHDAVGCRYFDLFDAVPGRGHERETSRVRAPRPEEVALLDGFQNEIAATGKKQQQTFKRKE